MNYINKNNPARKTIGDQIVNEFIENQRRIGNQCTYHLFGFTPYKNQLRDALIEEQDGYCCYCMREIRKDATTTLEHVIPKGSTVTEVNDYKNSYPNYFNEVVHLNSFEKTSIPPPYPHAVSYQNIVASCKGILEEGIETSSCCNNKRQHSRIHPIMFDSRVGNLVEYMKLSGKATSCNKRDNSIDSTITILGLNNDTLKEIRILWAMVATKAIVTTSKRDVLINLFGTDLVSQIDHVNERYKKYFTNDYYWSLFLSYKWFHSYFKATIIS